MNKITAAKCAPGPSTAKATSSDLKGCSESTRLGNLLANLEIEINSTHSALSTLRNTLEPYLPQSEFSELQNCVGSEPSPVPYGISLDPSPVEVALVNAMNEIARLRDRINYHQMNILV
ncbi:hypothetical protein H1O16_gp186 [Burkholderia phage BcepSaruman]|uniref:Uncharacterized protein n=1 Tax=Burkholderia phage BcepSaruman TaxID=2530032 RepID=A0A4D5ZD24_9CAUD|nr:hypothetical protein H1O16_gp186 [Burkholderia phage BcepSaruman]QBX06599.1 hypothetical protein BcepSaruman_186 [Burkholderia phage BcepSaruman]